MSSRNQKYNPLFILFLCLVAAILVLLILSLVLGIRLGSTSKKLKAANAQITQLEQEITQLQDDLAVLREPTPSNVPDTVVPDTVESSLDADAPPQGGIDAGTASDSAGSSSSWLNLSGHSEVRVAPTNLLSGYTTYYTTAGVNLRSGPATSYARITTVDVGDPVQVAAKEGNWAFVKTGNYFGWISLEYLSTKEPGPMTVSSGSSTSSRAEATSGSLRTR